MLIPFWQTCIAEYKKHTNADNIISPILESSTKPLEMSDTKLIVACFNKGAKTYLDQPKNKKTLQEIVSNQANNKMTVEFIVDETAASPKKKKKKEEPLFTFEPSDEDILTRAGLNIAYKFENFAVSSENQVAFAAAQNVADNIGRSYNPLFFHGGVGVGKTHLSQSIARRLLEQNPEARVYFSPGDQFTNELIEAIGQKSTPKFRRKYRQLKLLVIDDIQFIAGKKTIQEEFFHTFNTIVSAGGQVVLNSDRPPQEIKNLEDRLRSRFSGGLIVDVQKPDIELRTAILLIKAKEKGIAIDMDAAQMISEYTEDTRGLEGALFSIYTKILYSNKNRIDIESAREHFQEQTAKKKRKITPSDVIKTVCSYYDIKQSQIKSATRLSNIALPRQVAMYLLRHEYKLKLEEVAMILKRKDHTTIIHGVDKIGRMVMKDPDFKEDITRIVSMLDQST